MLDAEGRTELQKNLTIQLPFLCSAFRSLKLPINFVCFGESHSRVVKLGFSLLQLFASENKSGLNRTRILAGIRLLLCYLLCDAISSYLLNLLIYSFIYLFNLFI